MNKLIMEVPYFQVPNDIFELGLSTNEMMVFFYLSRCGNNGKTAFPSYETIAKKTSTSKSTAIRVVKSLTEKGLLIKEIRRDKETGRNKSNLYRVAVNLSEMLNGGVTETQGMVSDRNKESVTETHNKEISIKNNIDKEINNIHNFNKPKVDTSIKNNYEDFTDIENHFKQFTNNDNVIELVGYFWTYLLNFNKIKHGLLTDERVIYIIHQIDEAYAEDYMFYDANEEEFEYRDYIHELFKEYFKEKRKYYSLQEFAQLENFRIWSERLK